MRQKTCLAKTSNTNEQQKSMNNSLTTENSSLVRQESMKCVFLHESELCRKPASTWEYSTRSCTQKTLATCVHLVLEHAVLINQFLCTHLSWMLSSPSWSSASSSVARWWMSRCVSVETNNKRSLITTMVQWDGWQSVKMTNETTLLLDRVGRLRSDNCVLEQCWPKQYSLWQRCHPIQTSYKIAK